MKKEALIKALTEERERFARNGHDTSEHDVTITYLKTGIVPRYSDDYDMLISAMEDFDSLCSDYDVN